MQLTELSASQPGQAFVTVAAFALGIGAACLRLPAALASSFWQDEVASARVVQQPTFAAMLHQVVRTESTPPLWYALAWTLHGSGVSIHDARLLSVAFDGLAVALIVMLASRLLPLALALAAGAIASVTAQLSAHGSELRAYELLAVLVLAFAACLDRAIQRPDLRRLAPLAAVVAAGLLTHYFFAFTVAAALLWVVLEPTAGRARSRVLAAIVAGCCFAALWLPWFLRQYRADRYSWIGSFSTGKVVATPIRLLAPSFASPTGAGLLVSWLVLAVTLAMRTGARARLYSSLGVLPILFAALTWGVGVRVYATRNLIGAAPFTAILLLLPMSRMRSRASLAAAAALVVVFAISYGINQLKPGVPYKGLAAALVADGWRPSSPVAVVDGPHALKSPLEWYLPGAPQFVARLAPPRGTSPVLAVLGARSHARGVLRDAIKVSGWLVGRLPIGKQRAAYSGLTLLAPTATSESRLAIHRPPRSHGRRTSYRPD